MGVHSFDVPHSRSKPFSSSKAMGGVKISKFLVIWLRITFIWKSFSETSSSQIVHLVCMVVLAVVWTSRTVSESEYSFLICRGGTTINHPRSIVGIPKKALFFEYLNVTLSVITRRKLDIWHSPLNILQKSTAWCCKGSVLSLLSMLRTVAEYQQCSGFSRILHPDGRIVSSSRRTT